MAEDIRIVDLPGIPTFADSLLARLEQMRVQRDAAQDEARAYHAALDDIHDWCDPRDWPTNAAARHVAEEIKYRSGVALGLVEAKPWDRGAEVVGVNHG